MQVPVIQTSTSHPIRQPDEFPHLLIHIGFLNHPKMMIELLVVARHLCNFLEAKIVRKGLFEGKNHVYEVLTQQRDVGDALAGCGNAYHCFGRMDFYFSNLFEFIDEVIEQGKGMRGFSVQEFFKCFVRGIGLLAHLDFVS